MKLRRKKINHDMMIERISKLLNYYLVFVDDKYKAVHLILAVRNVI